MMARDSRTHTRLCLSAVLARGRIYKQRPPLLSPVSFPFLLLFLLLLLGLSRAHTQIPSGAHLLARACSVGDLLFVVCAGATYVHMAGRA